MFRTDDKSKAIRNALIYLGCSGARIKEWQKCNEKIKKQLPAVKSTYENGYSSLLTVFEDVKRLEDLLQRRDQLSKDEEREIKGIIKDLNRLSGSWEHEFLVSQMDEEFRQIYKALVKLGDNFLENKQDGILFLSEVENLLSITGEILERTKPNLKKLCYFNLNYSADELIKLPPSEGLITINNVYKEEYLDPIVELVKEGISKADERKRALEGDTSRAARRELDNISPLLENTNEDMMTRVKMIIQEL